MLAELRAEVDVIEQMSSSGSSSSSDSASASGSDDSSSSDAEHDAPRPLSQASPNRHPMANGGVDRQQGNNQLMNTLRKYPAVKRPLHREKESFSLFLTCDTDILLSVPVYINQGIVGILAWED